MTSRRGSPLTATIASPTCTPARAAGEPRGDGDDPGVGHPAMLGKFDARAGMTVGRPATTATRRVEAIRSSASIRSVRRSSRSVRQPDAVRCRAGLQVRRGALRRRRWAERRVSAAPPRAIARPRPGHQQRRGVGPTPGVAQRHQRPGQTGPRREAEVLEQRQGRGDGPLPAVRARRPGRGRTAASRRARCPGRRPPRRPGRGQGHARHGQQQLEPDADGQDQQARPHEADLAPAGRRAGRPARRRPSRPGW